MNKRIKQRQDAHPTGEVMERIYISAIPVNSFYAIPSTTFTKNDEGFSDTMDRVLRKYSKAWDELSRM